MSVSKDVKKTIIYIFICIAICILLFGGGYLFGRNRRIYNLSKSGTEAEYQVKQLQQQLSDLQQQQQKTIERCEQLEQQLVSAGNSIDVCIGTTGQLRSTISELNIESGNIGELIKQLRIRITELQDRSDELSKQLSDAKSSTNFK